MTRGVPRAWRRAVAAAAAAGLCSCAAGPPGPAAGRSTAPASGPMVTGARSALYVEPAAGGAPRPLLPAAESAALVSVADPVWSPDGRRIAFTAGCPSCAAKLYVVSATGAGLRQIPTGPGAVSSPGWSPDGRSIVFARDDGDTQFIYSVSLRAGRVRLVNGEPPGADNTDSTPAWSPDGRQVAFTREVHHEKVSLYVVPSSGGKPAQLTRPGQFDQIHPRWSPDGREIVYMQSVPPDITWDLALLDVATGRTRLLTRDPHNEFDPAWSPGGASVVFAGDAASRAGFRSLYVIGADGAGLRRLTAPAAADDSMPAWSPDGTTIVFVRRPTERV